MESPGTSPACLPACLPGSPVVGSLGASPYSSISCCPAPSDTHTTQWPCTHNHGGAVGRAADAVVCMQSRREAAWQLTGGWRVRVAGSKVLHRGGQGAGSWWAAGGQLVGSWGAPRSAPAGGGSRPAPRGFRPAPRGSPGSGRCPRHLRGCWRQVWGEEGGHSSCGEAGSSSGVGGRQPRHLWGRRRTPPTRRPCIPPPPVQAQLRSHPPLAMLPCMATNPERLPTTCSRQQHGGGVC